MSALAEHMAAGASTVSRIWIIRRTDGRTLGFTDHDCALDFDGIRCAASSGMTAGALQQATGLAVDNVEATGALSDDAISEADLRAGRFDGAEVTIWLVNWADVTMREMLFRGTMGEIGWGEGAFSVELRGLSEALNQARGRVFQSRCDAVLGDRRCGVDFGPLFSAEVDIETVEGSVVSIPELRHFAPKWFERGRLIALSGPANGLSERIKTDRTGNGIREIALWAALRAPLMPGDRVRIEAGCDKLRDTCRFKFDNLINFRGFPDMPGEDWLMAYPKSAGRNDGGRG